MAYVDQNMGKERTVAAVITAAILAIVGYMFYTGLAFNVIKKAAQDLNVIDIKDQPPPPPKVPPPPPKQEKAPPPPISAPPPLVSAPTPPVFTAPPPPPYTPPAPPTITPPAPPAPPAKPSQASGLKPKGAPGDWVTSDDYPPGALRNEEQGSTGFKLSVGPDGRVTGCTVTRSSGFPDLDDTACKLLPRRARFTPAKDTAGNGMAAEYSSTIRWQIPKD
jgi:protein TonB